MLYINHQNPLAHQQDIYLEQLNAYHLVTYNEFGVLPYADIYQRFPKWQIKILPTREAMFNLIAKEPKYIGIFSSICLSNCSYIRDGIIYAKDLADYPMPLILVLFYPKNQKDDILVHTIKQLLINALFSSPLLQ